MHVLTRERRELLEEPDRFSGDPDLTDEAIRNNRDLDGVVLYIMERHADRALIEADPEYVVSLGCRSYRR